MLRCFRIGFLPDEDDNDGVGARDPFAESVLLSLRRKGEGGSWCAVCCQSEPMWRGP